MKILVTGGCGFLGSHVCEFFREKGWEVVAYDNLTKFELERTGFSTEKSRNYNSDFLRGIGVGIVKADVRSFEEFLDHSSGCDFIVHTAAQPAMTISWENPQLDFTTNALGTFNVLEAARRHKIPMASCATVHIYGNRINTELSEGATRYIRNPVGISEEYPTLTGVLTPLHASKAAGDTLVRTYIDTYQVDVASFRLTGIYGPRQFGGEDHGWVANFAIRSILGWPITIFGSGKQVRDIIYATDICEAFEAFFKKRKAGIYNIGGGSLTSISLLECINLLERINSRRPEVKFGPDRHGDLRYFVCDISRARKELDWEPRVKPDEGIGRLVTWIKEIQKILKK